MKKILCFALAALPLMMAGCSDDFLNDNLTPATTPVGDSEIIISPAWPADSYRMALPVAGGTFTITETPAWLIVDPLSGELSGGIGYLRCRATASAELTQPGIYMDKMSVVVNGTTYFVVVGYLNEGTPTIEVEHSFTIDIRSYAAYPVIIRNTGEGVLLWEVDYMPPWLRIDTISYGPIVPWLTQGASAYLPLLLNPDNLPQESGTLTDAIVLRTNDKEHPTVVIGVALDMGTPSLTLESSPQINFGSTETQRAIRLKNGGDGLLVWRIDGAPAWLTLSATSGVEVNQGSRIITLTANRSLLSDGTTTAEMYLNSNDPDLPSILLTLTIRNDDSGM